MQIFCSGDCLRSWRLWSKARKWRLGQGLHESQLHLLQSAGGLFLYTCSSPASHLAHSPGTDEGDRGGRSVPTARVRLAFSFNCEGNEGLSSEGKWAQGGVQATREGQGSCSK